MAEVESVSFSKWKAKRGGGEGGYTGHSAGENHQVGDVLAHADGDLAECLSLSSVDVGWRTRGGLGRGGKYTDHRIPRLLRLLMPTHRPPRRAVLIPDIPDGEIAPGKLVEGCLFETALGNPARAPLSVVGYAVREGRGEDLVLEGFGEGGVDGGEGDLVDGGGGEEGVGKAVDVGVYSEEGHGVEGHGGMAC